MTFVLVFKREQIDSSRLREGKKRGKEIGKMLRDKYSKVIRKFLPINLLEVVSDFRELSMDTMKYQNQIENLRILFSLSILSQCSHIFMNISTGVLKGKGVAPSLYPRPICM